MAKKIPEVVETQFIHEEITGDAFHYFADVLGPHSQDLKKIEDYHRRGLLGAGIPWEDDYRRIYMRAFKAIRADLLKLSKYYHELAQHTIGARARKPRKPQRSIYMPDYLADEVELLAQKAAYAKAKAAGKSNKQIAADTVAAGEKARKQVTKKKKKRRTKAQLAADIADVKKQTQEDELDKIMGDLGEALGVEKPKKPKISKEARAAEKRAKARKKRREAAAKKKKAPAKKKPARSSAKKKAAPKKGETVAEYATRMKRIEIELAAEKKKKEKAARERAKAKKKAEKKHQELGEQLALINPAGPATIAEIAAAAAERDWK